MRKTFIRFFTIADYKEEENWLREQHRNGWKMTGMTLPCFYTFESCAPEDVIYRLDFKNGQPNGEYMQLAKDFGWEYFEDCAGWLYFRKSADSAEADGEDELFSDDASRLDMVRRIVTTRLLPLAAIFLCCVIPNLITALNGGMSVFSGFFIFFGGIMFVIYTYMILHCGFKLRRIREQLSEGR